MTLARLVTAGVGGLLRLGCYDEHLGEASACAGMAVPPIFYVQVILYTRDAYFFVTTLLPCQTFKNH